MKIGQAVIYHKPISETLGLSETFAIYGEKGKKIHSQNGALYRTERNSEGTIININGSILYIYFSSLDMTAAIGMDIFLKHFYIKCNYNQYWAKLNEA